MNHKKYKFLVIAFCIATGLAACKKPWADRIQVIDQQLNVNLLQQIQANANLSIFTSLLVKTGYDKLLASTKTYTVWAPANSALTNIDPTILADTGLLRKFVGNHIANQAYLTTNLQGSLKIHTLIGKNVTFTSTTVEDANITLVNQYVSNGVLHIIDKPLAPKLNISEFVRSLTAVGQLQLAYIQRRDTSFIDTSKATVSSINPVTGKPILVPGTGVVSYNTYFNRVGSLANEDSTYTYFVLTDAAYNTERNKVSKYFATVTNSTDTTMNILAGNNVLKDVCVRGIVLPANLPSTLTSVNGVPIPIDKSAIVQTFNASNGIVYVMNSINFNVADKITPVVIQGERASFYARTDQSGKIGIRVKNDLNGLRYNDLFISGSGLPASFFAAYRINNLYTCQYKVVWMAPNDTVYTKVNTISQRIMFGQITAVTTTSGTIVPVTVVNFPYTNVGPYNYNEVQLTGATAGAAGSTLTTTNGTLNVTKFGPVNMYVQGANSTTTNANDILVDYVKLVPILQ